MENMEPPTERMLHAVADDAGEVMTDAAKRATPKDRGVVAASWRTLPTEKVPSVMGDAYVSGTTNPHRVARFLEYGVEAHFIGPKTAKALGLDVGPRGGAHHPASARTHDRSRRRRGRSATRPDRGASPVGLAAAHRGRSLEVPMSARPCLGCGRLISRGSRCRRCESKRQRNTPGRRNPKRFRREVLAKTGGRCARCGSTRKVSAHHRIGMGNGGDDDPRNGEPLCSRCHAKEEARRRGSARP
jgi:hypothetical protein